MRGFVRAELTPPGYRVTILADRGFGDQKLFAFLRLASIRLMLRKLCNPK